MHNEQPSMHNFDFGEAQEKLALLTCKVMFPNCKTFWHENPILLVYGIKCTFEEYLLFTLLDPESTNKFCSLKRPRIIRSLTLKKLP